jgi:phosphoribosylformylglycinamidine synthase subunit PurS
MWSKSALANIELNITAATQQLAEAQVDRMCDQLLANTVVENYRFELKAVAATATTGA